MEDRTAGAPSPLRLVKLQRHESLDARRAEVDDLVEPDRTRAAAMKLLGQLVLIGWDLFGELQDLAPRHLRDVHGVFCLVDTDDVTACVGMTIMPSLSPVHFDFDFLRLELFFVGHDVSYSRGARGH